MGNIPRQVQLKIDKYNQFIQSIKEGEEAAQKRIDALEAELSVARQKLREAMEKTIANPSPQNEADEVELRKRVVELELYLTSARERKQYSSLSVYKDGKKLAIEAMRTAREYVLKEWENRESEKLKAIARAKQAYLQALADYGAFRRGLLEIFMTTARETNANYIDDVGGVPNLNEPAWGYRDWPGADGHLYTITQRDMDEALRGEYKSPPNL